MGWLSVKDERQLRRDLAGYVRRRLLEKNWSQVELAKRMGDKNKARVARILAGDEAEGLALTLPLIIDLAHGLAERPLRLLAEVLADPERTEALRKDAQAHFDSRMREVVGQLHQKELAGVQGEHARGLFSLIGYLSREGEDDAVEKILWMVRGIALRHTMTKMADFIADLPEDSRPQVLDGLLFKAFTEDQK